MRTTIRIKDELLNEAKKMALSKNTTVSDLIDSALREMLYRRRQRVRKRQVHLVTFRGKGLKHGVDLDDTASLLDLMEGE